MGQPAGSNLSINDPSTIGHNAESSRSIGNLRRGLHDFGCQLDHGICSIGAFSVWHCENRVEIYRQQARACGGGERGEPRQHLGQGRDIGGLPTPRPQEQRRAFDRANHLLGDVLSEGTAAEHNVLHHLDEDAAETKHRDRTEDRVAMNAEDALNLAFKLLSDKNAFDPGSRRMLAGALIQRRIGGAYRLYVADAQDHPADLRLMHYVGGENLHDDGKAERLRRRDRLIRGRTGAFRWGLDAASSEEQLRLEFIWRLSGK